MTSALIVGLGNPGSNYERTRHNLGFIFLRALAKKRGVTFKKLDKFEGELAIQNCEERQLLFFLPMTYMNNSGRAVKKVVSYYNIEVSSKDNFLVACDDVYLNFNTLRLRAQGGSGGHNGLKSLEEHLQTNNFARLRLGIGPKDEEEILEDYVLGNFTDIEQNNLPEFIAHGTEVIECWLKEGFDKTLNLIADNRPLA